MVLESVLSPSPVQQIIDVYTEYGQSDYIGESVTQVQHALEAAYHAQRAGQTDVVVIASLLHDIGHLIGIRQCKQHMSNLGILSHESVGADWLRHLGMDDTVCNLVESHVSAKRYLCWKNQQYYSKLSSASKQTLTYQGGVMNDAEAHEFEQNPRFDTILLMRSFDEAAKSNTDVPSFEEYRSKLSQLIAKPHR